MTIYSNPFDSTSEEVDEYVESIMALVGERDPIEILEGTLARVESAVASMSESELRQPEAPGKWSAVEVVQHLADSELVWAYRLRLVLAQNGAELTGYDQDRWAAGLGYADARLDDAMHQFRVLREANLRVLRAATPEQMAHVGRHAERGPESVEHTCRLYAGHDVVHSRQLERIAATRVNDRSSG